VLFLLALSLLDVLGAETVLRTPRCEITEKDGSVSAVGTWFDTINKRPVSDVLTGAHDFEAATTSILCDKKLRICTVADARVLDGRLLTWVRVYGIRAWKAGYVQAVLDDGCVKLTMAIEEANNTAMVTRTVSPQCRTNPQWTSGTFRLGDGTEH
jgi:hypothetical protein